MNQKHKQLTDIQRYQIEAYLRVGMSKTFIANQLGIYTPSSMKPARFVNTLEKIGDNSESNAKHS